MGIRLVFLSVFGISYFLIFMISSYILRTTHIIEYFDTLQTVLQSGIFIHVLMAGLLFIWGIFLLTSKKKHGEHGSHAWLMLAVPCPVCMMTIFFSAGFLVAFFPSSGHWPVLFAYQGFMGISLVTLLILSFWRGKSEIYPESMLGGFMIFIAVYFVLAVLIMPQFGDIDKIYRLAKYNTNKELISVGQSFSLYTVIVSAFLFGYLSMIRKIRRTGHWISARY